MKFFHVSDSDLGKEIVLFPRTPLRKTWAEPVEPKRICVSPRIGDALRLSPWRKDPAQAYVYVVEVKRLPKASWTLPRVYAVDHRKPFREEVWLLNGEGYLFKRLGLVRFDGVGLLAGGSFWGFKKEGIEYNTPDTAQMSKAELKRFEKLRTLRLRADRAATRAFREGGRLEAFSVGRFEEDRIKVLVKRDSKSYRVPVKGNC